MVLVRSWHLVLLLVSLLPVGIWGQKAIQPLDPFFLHEVRISITDPHWEARLARYKKEARKDEIPCTVWLDGVRLDSVGIRFKGNSSYNSLQGQGSRKLPFSLDADAFRKGARFPAGIAELKLANGFKDPSMMREVLAYYIARTYMPAPRSAFARLVINDEYFGVYSLTEDIDRSFLQKWFGESTGALFKCDPDWSAPRDTNCPLSDKASLEYVGDDPACYRPFFDMKYGDWTALTGLTRRLSDEKPPLDSLLDVDRVLWMHAFNNVLVNLDSYSGRLCHNYFLYQSRSGQFVPLIWDMNLAFGGFRMARSENLSADELIGLPPLLHAEEESRPLISKLLADSLNRKVYIGHIRTILGDFFQNGKYKDLISTWSGLLQSAVAEETFGLYGLDSFRKNASSTVLAGKVPVIGIQELMEGRAAFLLGHPDLAGQRPACFQYKTLRLKSKVQFDCFWTHTEKVHLYWRVKGSAGFQKLIMPKTKTKGKGGSVLFRALLPWSRSGIEFYMVGENACCATAVPKTGSHKPLKAG